LTVLPYPLHSAKTPERTGEWRQADQPLGVAFSGLGTYTSVIHADGSLHGDGQGIEMTAEGQSVT